MKRLSSFVKGAGLLAVCAIVAKIIGAFYRIPLTNILGAEGIGLYQMVFPLYTVLLTISSGGLPVAIAKTVAQRGADSAKHLVKVAVVALSISGAIGAIIIAMLSGVISRAQGNSSAALAYLGIAPSVLFVAVISCFRGYFQGRHNMFPTAISQLIEQVVKLVLGLLFAYMLMPRGAMMGVLGSVLGVSLSEAATMVVLIIMYYANQRKAAKVLSANSNGALTESAGEIAINNKNTGEIAITATQKSQRRIILKEIYRIAVPVTLGSLVLPLTQVIDSFLVINILTRVGVGAGIATSLYGLVTGPVNSLINMPSVITFSLAGVLLPRVSAAHAKGLPLQNIVHKTLKSAVALGAVMSILLMLFSPIVMKILYSSGLSQNELALASALLKIGAVGVFYVSIIQVATAVLQGTDLSYLPAINLLIGAVLKVALNLLLLPFFGVGGAVAATAACYGLTCILDCIAMKKVLNRGLVKKQYKI